LILEAQRIFDGLPLRDGISWNVIISAHARHGHGREALHLFDCMHSEGFFPDALTLIGALKACGIVGALDKGREIQAEIVKEEWTRKHDSVGNALVDMYSKCGSIEEARDVFDELPFRNVSSWNALISGYGHHDRAEEALQCFELMQSAGASPDSVTFVCILKACGRVGAMEMGQRVHAEIVSQGLLRHSRVGHGVVDMYAKCGAMAEAQEAFDGLMLQDAVPWNSLLLGYAQLGDDGSVFELFDKMMGTQAVEPDSITFLVILYLCSHSGLVLWGEICFDTMITGYGIVPTLQHCNCMIDLYARAGHLQLVMEIIEEMPFHGNLVSRRSVLSSFC
jgi:pentatricopeptide repeat protein